MSTTTRILERMSGEDDFFVATCGVLTVEGPAPSLDALRAEIADRLDRAPLLRYRLGDDRSRWVPVDDFDPSPHVREVELAPEDDTIAAILALPPLPLDRPPWELVMLHGHASDEYTLCYRTHVMFQDGTSMIGTLEALFGRRRLGEPGARAARAPKRGRAADPASGRPSVRERLDLGVRLRRRPRWSPNKVPSTGEYTITRVDLDVAQLLAVARANRATLNQVCLAALTGALRAWTPEDWPGPEVGRALPAYIPIDLRPPDRSGTFGPDVGILPLDLPCGRSSPREHLRQVMSQTGERRIRVHRDRGRAVSNRIPYRLAKAMLERVVDPDFIAMGVTTLRVAPGLAVAEAPVRRVMTLPGFVPRQRLNIVIVQYGNAVTAFLVTDTALAASPGTRPERLAALWREALEELHTACA
ncbi:wax ester/triacylglycerol synthase domain-containing protein [Actinomadura fibrosa]|uniref:diacylglycerol O-acyltransferase n=1 Tax=Actinomadura fibrosa TaxID=111802 RepID=A0ABW2XFL8_9ACTN|nr:wax ester/triacylglycerol synthase domain-containing protein [Actinomadura fibrosa]